MTNKAIRDQLINWFDLIPTMEHKHLYIIKRYYLFVVTNYLLLSHHTGTITIYQSLKDSTKYNPKPWLPDYHQQINGKMKKTTSDNEMTVENGR